MDDGAIRAIIGGAIIGLVVGLITLGLMFLLPPGHCPDCKKPMPKFKPKTERVGGKLALVCESCGCKMNRRLKKV
jgi:hypothetical protein